MIMALGISLMKMVKLNIIMRVLSCDGHDRDNACVIFTDWSLLQYLLGFMTIDIYCYYYFYFFFTYGQLPTVAAAM